MVRKSIKHVTYGVDGESSGHEPCDILENGGCSTRNPDLTIEADSIEDLLLPVNEETAEELVAAFFERNPDTKTSD